MRVLIVTYCRAMLGANRAMLGMIRDMRERYHVEFTVLMPKVEDGNLAEVLKKEDVPYHIAAMKMWVMPSDAKYRALRGISAQIKTFFLSRNILRQLRGEQYDLVYTNNSTVQYGAIIAKKIKSPHIWHIREFGQDHGDYDYEYSYPYRKRIRYFCSADQVITISDAMVRYAREELCPGANVIRIYDGIEITKPLRQEWNQSEPLRIVCVAALQEGKNQMELIQAAERLIERGNTEIEINLIGDGAKYRAELELYVAQHRLSRYIRFWGYQEDVTQLLDQMDVGVICSRSEGFGLVTCEYMVASLPVIGADSGATPELVVDGETGYLYPSGDVNKLAECIRLFCQERSRLKQMGTSGYKRVSDHFRREKNTEQIYSIFSQFV